jgi:hypothetical protein
LPEKLIPSFWGRTAFFRRLALFVQEALLDDVKEGFRFYTAARRAFYTFAVGKASGMAEVLKSGKRRTPEDGIAAFVQEEEVVEFFVDVGGGLV